MKAQVLRSKGNKKESKKNVKWGKGSKPNEVEWNTKAQAKNKGRKDQTKKEETKTKAREKQGKKKESNNEIGKKTK